MAQPLIVPACSKARARKACWQASCRQYRAIAASLSLTMRVLGETILIRWNSQTGDGSFTPSSLDLHHTTAETAETAEWHLVTACSLADVVLHCRSWQGARSPGIRVLRYARRKMNCIMSKPVFSSRDYRLRLRSVQIYQTLIASISALLCF